MTKHSRLRAADNHIHYTDEPDTRTEADMWTDLHVSRLRMLIVDALDVPESFEFVKEMTDCPDRLDRLATVRSWAHRVGIETRAPECVHKQETAGRLTAERVRNEVSLAQKRAARHTLLNQDSSGGQSYWITLLKLDGDISDLEKELIQ
jgi:hypothetical protein